MYKMVQSAEFMFVSNTSQSNFVCVSGKLRQVKSAELQMAQWWWLFLRHEIIPSVNTKHSNANIFINNSQPGTQPATFGLLEQLNNNDVFKNISTFYLQSNFK